ncbi:hypothetical protein [Kitasatospora sp. NPDC101183]|uniref:hypothetical protein n=1 Tax=Kitasatospora sp. NPDC101183 TaxID=3364100 RepID=UPI00381B5C79
MALSLLGALTGCSGSDAGSSVRHGDAGSVAVAYTDRLFNGRSKEAEPLVDPTALGAFRVIAAEMSAGATQARDLRVAAVVANGKRATVTLSGTLCVDRSPSRTAGASPDSAHCRTRKADSAPDPAFVVKLVQEGSAWQVYYPS